METGCKLSKEDLRDY